jgi:GDPmannose 4,6-dehydratase
MNDFITHITDDEIIKLYEPINQPISYLDFTKRYLLHKLKNHYRHQLIDKIGNDCWNLIVDYLKIDEKYFRREELRDLRGDSSKLRDLTGWEPEYTFESMLDEMIEYWLQHYKNK